MRLVFDGSKGWFALVELVVEKAEQWTGSCMIVV